MVRLQKSVIAAVLICLVLLPSIALAADQVIGKTRDLRIYEATVVADTVLKPGEYRVRHVMQGEEHIVVFLKARGSQELARVNCKMTKLDAPAKATSLTYVKQSDGSMRLRELVFRGDSEKHVF